MSVQIQPYSGNNFKSKESLLFLYGEQHLSVKFVEVLLEILSEMPPSNVTVFSNNIEEKPSKKIRS